MREVAAQLITDTVYDLCLQANRNLPGDIRDALAKSLEQEESPAAQNFFRILLENADIAACEQMAICQDTGQVVVFMDIGQDVHVMGGHVADAIQEGVRRAYRDGFFRNSIVEDPLQRVNTGDNTPAVIHYFIVPGTEVSIHVMPKGFGSENMSGLTMLTPADGEAGVIRFVTELVTKAGGNPCPPIIVGIGLGGTMEKAALLAKRALLRKVGERNERVHLEELEEKILASINATGIGSQGLGGTVTALAVFIEAYPTHIAGLPVAVNLSCHAARHAQATL
jgi:fumarate hydratase subunit alpha